MDLERARRAAESVASKRNAELSHLRKIKVSQTFEGAKNGDGSNFVDR